MNDIQKHVIFHVDLDAFFASCEERENPHFRGRPVIVGADPKEGRGRGVVSTANYAARKYGIHSAMPISQAWRIFASASSAGAPQAIFLPVNGSLYNRVSKSVMGILKDFTQKFNGKFEQVSIDEAYISFPVMQNLRDSINFVQKIATEIKETIYTEEKVSASVGVGPNMLIAKIASDFQKPDGLTIILPGEVQKFLDPMNVRKLPGVGPKTEYRLKKLKINTVLDLRKLSESYLYEIFGQHGVNLYNSSRGIDTREVAIEHETKSIGEEHTFDHDTEMLQQILPVFFNLVKNVLKTAKSEGFEKFKTLTIKVRYADFKTHTKSRSFKYSISNQKYIEDTALKLLWPFSTRGKKIRLIGFRVENFELGHLQNQIPSKN